jgi:hypothetical protein
MTYYEELGLQPDASLDEIRKAYRALARLLHPDAQAEPRLKALAECQMRRLADIIGTLSDPLKRLEYDAGLAHGEQRVVKVEWAPPVSSPSWPLWALRNWFWTLLGMVVLAVGAWVVTASDADGVRTTPEAVPAVAAVPGATKAPAPPPRHTPARELPPDLPPAVETAGPEATNVEVKEALPAAEPERPIADAFPEATKPDAAHSAAASDTSPFAGNWLYLPDKEKAAAPGQYAATYVELLLREENGALAGHYRSRHSVPDKAISPEVLLQVRGTLSPRKPAMLEWTSAGGAKGELELILRAPNVLAVTWWTTVFGFRNELSSGTAALIRQVAR